MLVSLAYGVGMLAAKALGSVQRWLGELNLGKERAVSGVFDEMQQMQSRETMYNIMIHGNDQGNRRMERARRSDMMVHIPRSWNLN